MIDTLFLLSPITTKLGTNFPEYWTRPKHEWSWVTLLGQGALLASTFWVASSPGSLGVNWICVGGKLRRRRTRAWSPLFLLSQLPSDFTGTHILFVILRVVDVVRMAEQEQNCILSWFLLWRSDPRHAAETPTLTQNAGVSLISRSNHAHTQNSVNLTQNFYTRLTCEKLHLQECKHVLSVSCQGLVKLWWAASWARVSRDITNSLLEYTCMQ